VLDDHAPTRRTLQHLLQRRGHEVTAAATLAGARDLLDKQSFDLFISDLGLPDGDGCTLMSELRTRQPNLVGVAVSGYGMNDDINRSRDSGFSQHLTKPVDMASIDRLLATLVTKPTGAP
jgi:CheY-like chemotaxis protein